MYVCMYVLCMCVCVYACRRNESVIPFQCRSMSLFYNAGTLLAGEIWRFENSILGLCGRGAGAYLASYRSVFIFCCGFVRPWRGRPDVGSCERVRVSDVCATRGVSAARPCNLRFELNWMRRSPEPAGRGCCWYFEVDVCVCSRERRHHAGQPRVATDYYVVYAAG